MEGGGGVNLILPVVFQKMYLLKERVKTCYFRTFNIIISHIFPENVIKIPQIVEKIMKNLSANISYFHRFFWIFCYFRVTKKLITSAYNR